MVKLDWALSIGNKGLAILSYGLGIINTIFKGDNPKYEIATLVAVIVDFYNLFFVFTFFPLFDFIFKYIYEYIPDQTKVMLLAYLFFVALGFPVFEFYLFNFIPGLNILPFATFGIIRRYMSERSQFGDQSQSVNQSGIVTQAMKKSVTWTQALIQMVAGLILIFILLSSLPLNNVLGTAVSQSTGVATTTAIEQFEDTRADIQSGTFFDRMKVSFTKMFEAPGLWWDKQYAIATGGYYQGQVDQYADKELGVFLKDVQAGEKTYFLGDVDNNGDPHNPPILIQIFAELEAESLELDDCGNYMEVDELNKYFSDREYTDEQINQYYGSLNLLYKNKEECLSKQQAKISCKLTNKVVNGVTVPETIDLFNIQGGGTALECTFDEQRLREGNEMVDFSVDFPFVTKSYLKTYLMDITRLRDMKIQKLDPTDYYKIIDKNPKSVHTAGPIMLGIGIVDSLPLTVNLNLKNDDNVIEQRQYRVGITIDNQWEGQVSEITQMQIILPEGMSLTCPNIFEPTVDPTVYEMTDILKRQIKAEKIKTSKSFNCRFGAINEEAAASLLQNVALATKYIKVTANYRYELKKTTTLKLKKGNAIKSTLPNCDDYCNDYDGCYCDMYCGEKGLFEAGYRFNCVGKYSPLETVKDVVSSVADTVGTVVTTVGDSVGTIGSAISESLGGKPSGDSTFTNIITTVYYSTSYEDKGKWCSDVGCLSPSSAYNGKSGIGDITTCLSQNKGYCCVPQSMRGFYEEVKCQGSGVYNNQVYQYDKIASTPEASVPLAGYTSGRTATGTDAKAHRTIAVNNKEGTQCYIKYGSNVYLDFGDDNPWSGWYVAEDTGSAFAGQCKIDVFAGVGYSAYKTAESYVSQKNPKVYVK